MDKAIFNTIFLPSPRSFSNTFDSCFYDFGKSGQLAVLCFNEINKGICGVDISALFQNKRNKTFIAPQIKSFIMEQPVYTMKAGRIGLEKMFKNRLAN